MKQKHLFSRLLLLLITVALIGMIPSTQRALAQGDQITYGFVQDPGDPLSITAVAYPNFTSTNVTVSSAVFTVLLPQGTTIDPAVALLPNSPSPMTNVNGLWNGQGLTEAVLAGFGLTVDLEGRDVYQIVMTPGTINNPAGGMTDGQPFDLFSFRLPSDCTSSTVEVLTNDSTLQQTILANTGANFNNQMSVSVDNAAAADLYNGNHPTSFSLPCPLAAPANPDTDNDGVTDDQDLDDDNDGILDHVECPAPLFKVDGSATSGVDGNATWTFAGTAAFQNFYNEAAATPTYYGSAPSLTVNFSVPVDNPSIRIDGVNDDDIIRVRVNGSVYTLDSSSASLSPEVTLTGPGSANPPTEMFFSSGNLTGPPAGAGNWAYQELTLLTTTVNSYAVETITGVGWGISAFSTSSAATCDADSDSIPDQLDLDSDNDGIPDNVEAQTTQGYVAPNGDAGPSNNGVDSAYTGGLTPVDTDGNSGENLPDYLDTDSDDDGTFDIEESGLADNDNNNDGMSDGPVGTNGLDDDATIEAADDYTDPSGLAHDGTNFALADSDNDTAADGSDAAPTGQDLDFRDDRNDTVLPPSCPAAAAPINLLPAGSLDFADYTYTQAAASGTGVINGNNFAITVSGSHIANRPNLINWPTGLPAPHNVTIEQLASRGSGSPGGTVEFNTFDTPLDDTYRIATLDLDVGEGMTIRAYDAANTLLPVSSWTREDFGSTGGITVNQSGTEIVLTSSAASVNDPTILFTPTPGQAISRLEFVFAPGGAASDIYLLQVACAIDTDNDGVDDATDIDDDNDGIPDADEGDGAVDTDGDGIPDSKDLDSDNDGILDLIESGAPNVDTLDPDGDGVIDTPVGNNGLADDIEDNDSPTADITYNGGEPVDTDGDTVPDFRDLDSDNDGINDVIEGGNGPSDPDGNGMVDPTPGSDVDQDGVQEPVDGDDTGFGDPDNMTPDTDGDNVPDYQDLDSDNDGINDVDEGGNGPADTDDDGMVDGSDPDMDGILDPVDGVPGTYGDANDPGPSDTDGDGVPDPQDLDSDNDGINDVEEGGNGPDDADNDGMIDPGPDTDGDGIQDPVDGDTGNFGDAGDPPHRDSDSDNVPDSQDLDSDNDGVNDVDEGGNGGLDPDGNGTIDPVPGSDPDMDGIQDPVDGDDTTFGDSGDPAPPETDPGSPEPDYLDGDDGTPTGTADPDGDGIVGDADDAPDTWGDSPPDTDGDGVPDANDLDDDNDGIPDSEEGDGAVDTDSDGIPDSLDLDSDNDGILDVIEAGHDGPDADGDGMVDGPVGTNGLPDAVETTPDSGTATYPENAADPTSPVDTDGDTVPDWRDLDSDNDGINDVDEGGNPDADSDGDGMADGPDTDGDGINDPVDGDDQNFGDEGDEGVPDTDGDDVPDYQDLDSDNDGINDIEEGGNGPDPDGMVDGPDNDGDGIQDPVDGDDNNFGDQNDPDHRDSDGDDIPDSQDLDSDNDGVNDVEEGGNGPSDPDGNGVIDPIPGSDPDGDGIQDPVDDDDASYGDSGDPAPPETDAGSPEPDYLDGDDGSPTGTQDPDGDGIVGDADQEPNVWGDGPPDTDGDGVTDDVDIDDDNDGIPDADEGPADADTDGDGVPDRLDLDSDNDGILDLVESGAPNLNTLDPDGDGVIDVPVGNNGLADPIETDDTDTADISYNGGEPVDTDGDTVPDFRDLDTDNDGVNDVDEGGNGPADTDNDGMVDSASDPDGDGVLSPVDADDQGFGDPNGYDPTDPGAPLDTDGDDAPDFRDLDADNDGINDVDEGGNGPLDTDGDGMIDPSPDTDGDGIQDPVDGDPATYGDDGDMPHKDTDGDGVPDTNDLDSDNDGINDVIEGGNGPLDGDDDGMVDGTDTDGDGILPPVDGDEGNFGDDTDPDHLDTDGDGVPDSQDLDSDNDTLPDLVEGGSGGPDADGNGVIDPSPDLDGDGIQDPVDDDPANYGDATGPALPDQDSGTDPNTPDYIDLDSDGDGQDDIDTTPNAPLDTNNDGKLDPTDTGGGTDDDMDGLDDLVDDSDLDGTPDVSDPDAPRFGGLIELPLQVDLDVMTNTPGPIRTNEVVSFTVAITNTGPTTITVLPVEGTFQGAYLTNPVGTPGADATAPNVLNWADVTTSIGDVPVGGTVSFVVTFNGGLDTTLLPNQETLFEARVGGTSDSDGIGIFAPTAILMAERSATYNASTGEVTLRWVPADESQIDGFHVYRWTGSDWQRLTDQPILVGDRFRSPDGSYEYTDMIGAVHTASATEDVARHYRLGVLMVNGSEVALDFGEASDEGTQVLLPFVTR